MFEKELQSMGLTEGESKVYEALLMLGNSTVGPVVKKSGVANSKIYDILNRLIAKGLASYTVKEKTRYFQAASPNRITEYLDVQESRIVKSKELLQKILPSIQDIRKMERMREDAEVFIGMKGLMSAHEMLIEDAKKGDEGYFFYVSNPTYDESAYKVYIKLRDLSNKYGLRWRGIANEPYRATRLAKQSSSVVKTKYVKFPVPGNIGIFKDRIVIAIWSAKSVGVLIHSQEVADNFRAYFEALWSMAGD